MKLPPVFHRFAVLPILACMALSSAPSAFSADAAAKFPNVVFLLADDLRPDGLASLGNSVVKTPAFDSLVSRGFIFHCAYVNGADVPAVCLPSRTQLLTGLNMTHARPFERKGAPEVTFARVFKAAGYATLHTGKNDNSPRGVTATFDETYDPGNAAQNADKAIDFIHRNAGTKPLFIYFAPHEPHDPQFATEEFYEMYQPAQIPLPAAFLPFQPFDNGEMTVRDEKTLSWPRTRENVTGKLARYYASISYLDAQVSRILQTLKDAGQYENTVFIVAGDNGLSLGEHGLLGKQNLYEFGGMHVPLAVTGPGVPKGETNALVYLYDLLPTACDLANITKPKIDGISLAPVIRGEKKLVRNILLTAYRDVQRAIRDDRWKLIRYPKVDKTQLFDLQNDPHEMTDLSGRPEYAEKVTAMLTLLAAQQKEIGDTVPLTVVNPKPSAWVPPDEKGSASDL